MTAFPTQLFQSHTNLKLVNLISGEMDFASLEQNVSVYLHFFCEKPNLRAKN
jgi:hypothetical protein